MTQVQPRTPSRPLRQTAFQPAKESLIETTALVAALEATAEHLVAASEEVAVDHLAAMAAREAQGMALSIAHLVLGAMT